VKVMPTGNATVESVDFAYEIFYSVFRRGHRYAEYRVSQYVRSIRQSG
jgi:hypothetical protein